MRSAEAYLCDFLEVFLSAYSSLGELFGGPVPLQLHYYSRQRPIG